MAATIDVIERTSEPPRLLAASRLRELYSYREILLNLVRKELKVKYTASVLGAVWSILNPVVFLGVFYLVFSVVLKNGIPNFPIFLLSGLLAWNLFSVSLTTGARSVIDNSNLVKKVYFPREILPLAAIGVALVDFVLQSGVLLAFILASGYGFHAVDLALLPLSIFTLLVFTAAVTFFVAALNVRYRDIQHLLNLGLLVWFWMTPVVYAGARVQQLGADHSLFGTHLFNLYLLNPMAAVVFGFQRALYGVVTPTAVVAGKLTNVPVLANVTVGWLAAVLGVVAAGSVVLLWLTWRTFFRLSGDFAEEL